MAPTTANPVQAKKKTELINLGTTKAALTKIKKKYAVVPDMTTKEGQAAFKSMNAECTPIRTGADREAKIQKEAAQTHIKAINSVLNVIVDTMKEVEAPWREAKKAVDDAEAKRKQEEQDKIDARTAEIEGKIGTIQSMTEGLLGAKVEVLQARLDMANKLVIDEAGYDEHVDAANIVLKSAITQLESAVAQAKQLEEGQKALKAQQEEMARNQQAIDDANAEKQQKLDDQQAEIDKQNQERLDREEEERQNNLNKQREQELKARLPEDKKMRAYANALGEVEVPEVKDPQMVALLRDTLCSVSDIIKMVNESTQS